MKYCEKCKKNFSSNYIECPLCGNSLIENQKITCHNCKEPFYVPLEVYKDLMEKRKLGHEIVCPICIDK